MAELTGGLALTILHQDNTTFCPGAGTAKQFTYCKGAVFFFSLRNEKCLDL